MLLLKFRYFVCFFSQLSETFGHKKNNSVYIFSNTCMNAAGKRQTSKHLVITANILLTSSPICAMLLDIVVIVT